MPTKTPYKKGILLDTSFWSSVFIPNSERHHLCKPFYERLLDEQYPLFLSAIVFSELSCHFTQDIDMSNRLEEITSNSVPLVFDHEHGLFAGKLWAKMNNPKYKQPCPRNDVQIYSQAYKNNDISYLITTDSDFPIIHQRASTEFNSATDLKILFIKNEDDITRFFDNGQYSIDLQSSL